MALRVGLIDIGAAGVVLVAILLPAPDQKIEQIFAAESALAEEIATAQADLARGPQRGATVERLAGLLVMAGQSDWAIRAAADVAARDDARDRWRASLAVSAAHVERWEISPAHEWAQKALEACNVGSEECPVYEHVRLMTYARALEAGVRSGIDPRTDPRAFEDAVRRELPTIRVQKPE
ncbi:MAG: hypothetical protein HY698_14280 [Deltaproteobacteria bacterium]|nr:hypothetical protein [Deltaproteobacteria bacterium]